MVERRLSWHAMLGSANTDETPQWDAETGRRGDGETERRRDGETGRRRDGETKRRRDGEKRRRGDATFVRASPRPRVSPSLCPPVSVFLWRNQERLCLFSQRRSIDGGIGSRR